MKRTLLALVCVLLSLAMVLSLTACSEEKSSKKKKRTTEEPAATTSGNEDPETPSVDDTDTIVGTWQATVDAGSVFEQRCESWLYSTYPTEVDLPSMTCDLRIECTYNPDGTATIDISFTSAEWLEVLMDAMMRSRAELENVSVQELLQKMGVVDQTLEQYVEEQAQTIVSGMRRSQSYTYSIKGDQLLLHAVDDEDADETEAYRFSLSDQTLKLYVGPDMIDEDTSEIMMQFSEQFDPLVFTRVSR